MATFRGASVVFGSGTQSWTGGIVSDTSSAFNQSVSFSREATVTDIFDGEGNVQAKVFSAIKKQVSISVIPYHASGAGAAITSLGLWALEPGEGTVSITDTYIAAMSDTYNIISTSVETTPTGVVVVNLVLESFKDSTPYEAQTA